MSMTPCTPSLDSILEPYSCSGRFHVCHCQQVAAVPPPIQPSPAVIVGAVALGLQLANGLRLCSVCNP